jgi:methylthioribose-1-phosphate isomerase
MKVDGRDIRPIWLAENQKYVQVIDQRFLPHEFVVADLQTVDDTIVAIREMYVRGAPLIGVTGAYGVYLALLNIPPGTSYETYMDKECCRLKDARPTAVNLAWGVDRVLSVVRQCRETHQWAEIARKEAAAIAEEEADNCKKIGLHGLTLIEAISRQKEGRTVNLLTHCNAGWLACIEHGTATAPMYAAFDAGLDIHVWVDETRPLNQGARLTAWELGKHGIKHTVITDNAGGHLMQHGMVDMVIVGTDRTTYTGDVANKIGTYLKALAAEDNNIPFYVALPSSTFDWSMRNGISEIPIETRDPDEIRYVQGMEAGKIRNVLIPPSNSPAGNYAFDVTPARLVTGFVTERGICKAMEADILKLFPEKTIAMDGSVS